MKKQNSYSYETPDVSVMELYSEGVLCASGDPSAVNEDYLGTDNFETLF